MKKLSALVLVLAVLFAVSGSSFAQPRLTLHVTGGYSLPLPDLKGTYPDDITKDPVPLFMKNGWNVGADGKFYVDKKLRSFGITLSLAYMSFSTGDIGPDSAKFKSQFNSFTAGLGVEYKFLTKKKAQPFVGAEFTANFLMGKYTPTAGAELTLKSTQRYGVTFGAGVDINLSKQVGVVIGAKYALMNLIGKKQFSDYDSSSIGADQYVLIDKEYTAGTTTFKARNLSYLQIYGGVSFYFMQPKKMMKKK